MRSSAGPRDAIARCERNRAYRAANRATAPNSPRTRFTQPGARPCRVISNVNAPPNTFSAAYVNRSGLPRSDPGNASTSAQPTNANPTSRTTNVNTALKKLAGCTLA